MPGLGRTSGDAFLPTHGSNTLALAAGLVFKSDAVQAKACGEIRVNGSYCVVGGAGVSCNYMRRWARRMVRDGRKPRGWDKCTIRRSGSGGCQRGPSRNRDFLVCYPSD